MLPRPLPRLAVFDVDGTLLSFEGRCSEATRRALAQLRRAGVVTAIATGRPLASLDETLDRIGPVDYAVCGNGSVVARVDSGELLRQSVVPADLVASVVAAVRASLPGVGLALEYGDRVIEEPGFHRRLPPREPAVSVPDALAALGSPIRDVQRVIFFHDDHDDDLPGLAARVRPHIDDRASLFYGAMLPIVEVIPAGANKAVALADLVSHLGCSAAETVAFGDGSNDIEMLQWAGLGVAMASASEVVRAVADQVTAPVEHDGVAAFVGQLLTRAANGRT